jgi:hypothetical protein
MCCTIVGGCEGWMKLLAQVERCVAEALASNKG